MRRHAERATVPATIHPRETVRMKLAFAGTPEFAGVMLDALLHSGHRIEAVFTRRDARAGRGNRVAESPVKQRAAAAGITVHQPRGMRAPEAARMLAAPAPDVLVVAAYGFLLPAPILAIPRLGCINVHASLLPRWRGAAPVHHAILAGDRRTGVSIMQMDAGLDTGPILATRACAIDPLDTAGSLTARLAELGAAALLDTLRALEAGAVESRAQDEARATLAPKLSKSQAAIDWTRPAVEIERMVRAFDPWPVAHTYVAGEDVPAFRVWRAGAAPGDPAAGPGAADDVRPADGYGGVAPGDATARPGTTDGLRPSAGRGDVASGDSTAQPDAADGVGPPAGRGDAAPGDPAARRPGSADGIRPADRRGGVAPDDATARPGTTDGIRPPAGHGDVASGGPSAEPGTVLRCDETGLAVATGDGVIEITELQPPGARRMSAAEFVRGRRLRPGTRLGRVTR